MKNAYPFLFGSVADRRNFVTKNRNISAQNGLT